MARLDYSGISLMIIGCFIPPLYYGFTCYPGIGAFYITAFVTFGTIGVVIGFIPTFNTPQYVYIRIGFYLFVGWSAVFPVIHLIYLMGIEVVWMCGKWLLLMGVLYSIGAVCYATRTPERWFPGSFNGSFLASHVIWHYFTIAAAGTHLWTCLYVYTLSRTIPCPNGLNPYFPVIDSITNGTLPLL